MNHVSPAHARFRTFLMLKLEPSCGFFTVEICHPAKHQFASIQSIKLAVSMVMTIALFAVIVRSFAAVPKHFSCSFAQVILLRFIPFHGYFLFQLRGSTFTFCSNSSSLSYGGLGHEPHTGLGILSQTRSDSDGRLGSYSSSSCRRPSYLC